MRNTLSLERFQIALVLTDEENIYIIVFEEGIATFVISIFLFKEIFFDSSVAIGLAVICKTDKL